MLGEEGLYYPKNDFMALSLIMKDLMKSPNKAAAQGEKAKMRACALYDWDRVTDQYEALLSTLTNTPASDT